MEAVMFFAGIPLLFGALQFCLNRTRSPRWVKWLTFCTVGGVTLVCWLASFNIIPLRNTYYFDRHSFLAFPDCLYVGLGGIQALIGLGLGAILAKLIEKIE